MELELELELNKLGFEYFNKNDYYSGKDFFLYIFLVGDKIQFVLRQYDHTVFNILIGNDWDTQKGEYIKQINKAWSEFITTLKSNPFIQCISDDTTFHEKLI